MSTVDAFSVLVGACALASAILFSLEIISPHPRAAQNTDVSTAWVRALPALVRSRALFPPILIVGLGASVFTGSATIWSRRQPDPAFAFVVTLRRASRPGQDHATAGIAQPHSGKPEPAGRRDPSPRRKARSFAPSIARFREALFLHLLTKLDLDHLLRRALVFAASIRWILEPETDRLKRQIAETRKRRESFSPAEPIEAKGPTYRFKRRITT